MKIFRIVSAAIILKVISATIAFFFSILVARHLGVERSGEFFLSLTVAMGFVVFGRFGLDISLMQEISAKGRNGSILQIFSDYIIIGLVASITASIMLYLNSSWLSEFIFKKPEIKPLLQMISVSVFFSVIYILLSEALKGLGKYHYSIIVQNITTPLVTILLLVLISSFRSFGSYFLIGVYTFATIVSVCIGLALWRNFSSFDSRKKQFEDAVVKRFNFTIIKKTFPFLIIAISDFSLQYTSVIVVGSFNNTSDIAVYYAALRMSALISFVLMAINTIIAPKMSAYYAAGQIKELSSIAKLSSAISLIASLPLIIVFFFFSSFILKLLYGNEFTSGSEVLMILSAGHFFNVLTGAVLFLLMMTGNENFVSKLSIVTLFTNIILNVILVNLYGIIGAAQATIITVFILNLSAFVYAYIKIGISTIPFIRSPALIKGYQQ